MVRINRNVLSIAVLFSLCAQTGCKPLADLAFLTLLWSAAEHDHTGSNHAALSAPDSQGMIDVVGVDETGAEVPIECAWSVDDGRVQIGPVESSDAGPLWARYR